MVSELCFGGGWCLADTWVVSRRCAVMSWVSCSCLGGVSVVCWRCSGCVLLALKEWHFFD